MLSWTLLFLVIAIIAGILRFWVVAGLVAWIALVKHAAKFFLNHRREVSLWWREK